MSDFTRIGKTTPLKFRLTPAICAAALLAIVLCSSATATPPAGDWNLVWSDEFDGTTLDTTKWDYGQKPWGTTDGGNCLINPEDTYLENGTLVNRQRMGDFGSYNFSVGWTYSKIWLTYGYLEIRAKYPFGKGEWPTWWMLKSGWPPEFDVAEYRGSPRNYMTQAFCWSDNGTQWTSNHLYESDGWDFTQWHVYGFEWGPGYLKWYVDGTQTQSFYGDVVPSDDMYVIFSAGLEDTADASTGFPDYYVIDYFRWYQTSTPTSLAATGGDGQVSLDWSDSFDPDFDYYNVYRDTESGGTYTQIATGIATSDYVDNTVTNGITYYYVVTAVDTASNESSYSNEASATPDTMEACLLLWWALNEGSGSTAGDSSGNNNDGAISGPGWSSPGYDGTSWCLSFDGTGDTVTDADAEAFLNGLDALTVSVWVKSNVTGTDRGILDTEEPDSNDDTLGLRYDAAGYSGGGTNVIKAAISTTGGSAKLESSTNAQTTEWQHLALTWSSGNQAALYIDGVQDTPSYNSGAAGGTVSNVTELLVGKCAKDSSSSWDGLIDELRIYNRVLSESEIAGLADSDSTPAQNPDPANEAPTVPIAAELTWTAGQGATAHDVYFGTADPPTFVTSQTACTYQPPLMDGTTTYYWRIDEINSGGTTTGDIWTFTTRIPGDVNADGSVNLADLQQFCDGWLMPEPEPDVDINGDGLVDFRDYAYLTENW